MDDDVQTIVGDDEEAAEAISKVVALHVIPDDLRVELSSAIAWPFVVGASTV